MQWGLIPSWAKDTKIGYKMINARADTIATKPSFRAAFKKRRCLVPADGFYEWLRVGKAKRPYLYEVDGGAPFALAGLWEQWWGPDNKDGPPLESFTLITTEANELASQIHDRMPVILDKGDYEAWLDPANQDSDSVQELLVPFPADRMTARPVNPIVNNARNEGPECVASSGEE
jgi:putative SOS response-associated peptidase YedK